MRQRPSQTLLVGLLLFIICVPLASRAAGYGQAVQDCMNAFKAQPESLQFCAAETCAYRACIADQSLSISNGDIVISGGRLTSVPAECYPYIRPMQQCIIQHLNQAIPPQVGSTWRVVESCFGSIFTGVWTRRPGTDIFDASWTKTAGENSGQKYTDIIDFKGIKNGQVTLYRRGNGGTYTGSLSADGGIVSDGMASWYVRGCSWKADISK